jgi:HK97 family phage major capsid protein
MAETNQELGQKMEALQARISDALGNLPQNPSDTDIKSVQTTVADLQGQLSTLTQERDARLRREELDGMKAQMTNLGEAMQTLMTEARSPAEGFRFEGGVPVLGEKAYQDGAVSLFKDIAKAHDGDQKAMGRLAEWSGSEGKAMTEGVEADGGFLVQPERIPGLLQARVNAPIMRNLIPTARVQTDKIEFVSVTSGLVAGWVAELAEKPQGDLSFSTLEASVFTAAGLAVASNQLLADSSIDRIIASELVKRVDDVLDKAIVNGTGTGQPLGILRTPGVTPIVYDDASPTVKELLAAIGQAVVATIDNQKTESLTIVMRPSTWYKIILDSDADGVYTLGSDNLNRARTAADSLPQRTLFGYPVRLSANIPNTLDAAGTGVGTQTRVIVGDFSEALLLERQNYTFDKSEHVFFTSNQTVFRGEGRFGFTAGRYPKAFSVVGGTGTIGF